MRFSCLNTFPLHGKVWERPRELPSLTFIIIITSRANTLAGRPAGCHYALRARIYGNGVIMCARGVRRAPRRRPRRRRRSKVACARHSDDFGRPFMSAMNPMIKNDTAQNYMLPPLREKKRPPSNCRGTGAVAATVRIQVVIIIIIIILCEFLSDNYHRTW